MVSAFGGVSVWVIRIYSPTVTPANAGVQYVGIRGFAGRTVDRQQE